MTKAGSMGTFNQYSRLMMDTVMEATMAAPEIAKNYHLSGTMPVSIADLPMVRSFDIDLQANNLNVQASEVFAKLCRHFGRRFKVGTADAEFGNYRGSIWMPDHKRHVEFDMLGAYENVSKKSLRMVPQFPIPTFTLDAFAARKAECLEDRAEIKDIFHLFCLEKYLGVPVRRHINRLEPEVLVEKLQLFKTRLNDLPGSVNAVRGMKTITPKQFAVRLEEEIAHQSFRLGVETKYLGQCTEPILPVAMAIPGGLPRNSRSTGFLD